MNETTYRIVEGIQDMMRSVLQDVDEVDDDSFDHIMEGFDNLRASYQPKAEVLRNPTGDLTDAQKLGKAIELVSSVRAKSEHGVAQRHKAYALRNITLLLDMI